MVGAGSNPDFRLPQPNELAALEAFLLAQEFPAGSDPRKFDLDGFATTHAQRRGRTLLFGATKCSRCHGGSVLASTTVSIQGKPIGVNAAFNTGVANQLINESGQDNLPCERSTAGVGPCGSREFSTPQLLNVKNLGPYFHDASAATLTRAVGFYTTPQFNSSPAGVAIEGITLNAAQLADLVKFLEGLVVRPYTLTGGPLLFGIQHEPAGPTASQNITITNSSSSPVTFTNAPNECTLTGTDPGEFVITSCPLGTPLEVSESRTVQIAFDPTGTGAKQAILEIHATDPSGVDLFGGTPAPTVQVLLPNGREVWTEGTVHIIGWNATNTESGGKFDVVLNDNGTRTAIASVSGDSRRHNWIVPGPATSTVTVEVSYKPPGGTSATATDASNANFTIAAAGSNLAPRYRVYRRHQGAPLDDRRERVPHTRDARLGARGDRTPDPEDRDTLERRHAGALVPPIPSGDPAAPLDHGPERVRHAAFLRLDPGTERRVHAQDGDRGDDGATVSARVRIPAAPLVDDGPERVQHAALLWLGTREQRRPRDKVSGRQ